MSGTFVLAVSGFIAAVLVLLFALLKPFSSSSRNRQNRTSVASLADDCVEAAVDVVASSSSGDYDTDDDWD